VVGSFAENLPRELYIEVAKNCESLCEIFWAGFGSEEPGVEGELRLFFSYIYEDLIAANFDRVAGRSDGRVRYHVTGSHVELPAMPGAGDDLAVEFPFTQGASPMHAYVIDGKELAFDIGYRDRRSTHLEFVNGAWRNLACLGCTDECH
jgi:hypothetical protein